MDLIEEITSTSAVAQCFLLDASAHLIRGDTGEINSMKGVAGAGDVLERVIDSIRLFLIQFQHREMDTNTELPTALIRPISTDHVEAGSHQIQQAGCAMVLTAQQVHNTDEFIGPIGVNPGDATRLSSPLSTRKPQKRTRTLATVRQGTV